MKIEFDNVNARITFESRRDRKVYEKIYGDSTVLAPGAEYTYAYKIWKKSKGKKGWDGLVRVLNKNGTFLVGLLPSVLKTLADKHITPTLIDSRPVINTKPDAGSASLLNALSLRGYQEEALSSGIENELNETSIPWPRGVFKMATGSGKTELAICLYNTFQVPSLFLVHRRNLVNQTIKRFQKYVHAVGKLSDGTYNPNTKGITVATIQTISSLIKKASMVDMDYLNKIEQVFFDEAHLVAASQAKGNQLVQTASMLPNAYYRWGLTATPFMRDKYSNWLLQGVTGKVLYSVGNAELIKLGFLVPPKIIMQKVPSSLYSSNKWPECYETGVILNNKRNDAIINALKEVPKPCIVMCKNIAHAIIIQRQAEAEGIKIPFIYGKNKVKEREDALNKLRNGRLFQIITTTIFDEGLDLQELRSLIFAGAGRSVIKTLQRIGRGLRPDSDKQNIVIVDFYDEFPRTLKKHSNERLAVYKSEGFDVEVIK